MPELERLQEIYKLSDPFIFAEISFFYQKLIVFFIPIYSSNNIIKTCTVFPLISAGPQISAVL